jgi:hypothetical protein
VLWSSYGAPCGWAQGLFGMKTVTQEYKGHAFIAETYGAFCDHHADGFVVADEAEETL